MYKRLPLTPVNAGLWPVPCPGRSWPGGVSATGRGRLVLVSGLDQSWLSPAPLCANRAEGVCRGLSFWGASVLGGSLFIVFLSEVPCTETLTDQELGYILWPLASLSQGDLFGNALGPDAADEPCRAAAAGARPARVAGAPWPPGASGKNCARMGLD